MTKAGLAHVPFRSYWAKHRLAAIIAGQVFDRYPKRYRCGAWPRRLGFRRSNFWDLARKQPPVSNAILQASGDLLCALGSCLSPATLWRDPGGRLAGDQRPFSIAGRGS